MYPPGDYKPQYPFFKCEVRVKKYDHITWAKVFVFTCPWCKKMIWHSAGNGSRVSHCKCTPEYNIYADPSEWKDDANIHPQPNTNQANQMNDRKYPEKNKKPADGEYTFYVFPVDDSPTAQYPAVKVNKLGQRTCKVGLSCSSTGASVNTTFDASEKGVKRLAAFLSAASGQQVDASTLSEDNFVDAIKTLACTKKVKAQIKRRDDYVAPNGQAYAQYTVGYFATPDPF